MRYHENFFRFFLQIFFYLVQRAVIHGRYRADGIARQRGYAFERHVLHEPAYHYEAFFFGQTGDVTRKVRRVVGDAVAVARVAHVVTQSVGRADVPAARAQFIRDHVDGDAVQPAVRVPTPDVGGRAPDPDEHVVHRFVRFFMA